MANGNDKQDWMTEQGFGEWSDESKYFTQIDEGMEAATQRDMYQPFFEAQTKKVQGEVLGADFTSFQWEYYWSQSY